MARDLTSPNIISASRSQFQLQKSKGTIKTHYHFYLQCCRFAIILFESECRWYLYRAPFPLPLILVPRNTQLYLPVAQQLPLASLSQPGSGEMSRFAVQSTVGGSTTGKLDHREQSSTIWANVSALWSTLNLSMSEPVGDFPVVSELHEDE